LSRVSSSEGKPLDNTRDPLLEAPGASDCTRKQQ
jgi:hypothetical protein